MTTPEPAATVVVPTRAGRARVETLLGLLEAQDTTDFDVVVVIDGDVDGTAAHLEQRASSVAVRVVAFPSNRGRSAALNAGIEEALGRVVIRCDDDLEPGPDFVRSHVAAHEGAARGVIGLYRNVFPGTPYA